MQNPKFFKKTINPLKAKTALLCAALNLFITGYSKMKMTKKLRIIILN